MSSVRLSLLAAFSLGFAQPCLAQQVADAALVHSVVTAQDVGSQHDVAATRVALDEAADRLVRHVLSINVTVGATSSAAIAMPQEAASGSSTLGTLSGSLGPIANSLSMITRTNDPAESNSLSDGLAITGAGLAVLGGALQLYSMKRATGSAGMDSNANYAALSDRGLRDQQRLAAGVIEDIERLITKEGAGFREADMPDWTRRADRALARANYVLREARHELATLTALLGEEVIGGVMTDAYPQWRRAQRALGEFPIIQ